MKNTHQLSQPLGNVTDYVIKIKFQMRGSPHAHCLLWVKDALRIGHNTDDEVCAFVDKYIIAVMSKPCKENEHDISMMKRLQKHTHSDYCRHRKTCHFGSPKPPSNKTIICHKPVDEAKSTLKDAKDVLEVVQHALRDTDTENPDITLDDILNNIALSMYMDALKVSPHGPTIILKRNPCDTYINQCNLNILHLWGGNVDLQHVMMKLQQSCMYVVI